ncbi:hypothetical protein [Streptococcus halichoeri]|uniref:hypothetical protein n=1 Tax=Streptococcus halichoeri TaxID=254785 RepID=UPI000DB8C051|nr:hypothetical protein [Streptococcus halichoeri]PZO95463.1 MAG: hypothetical protein DI617_03580 [Streptococcus pyogenes]
MSQHKSRTIALSAILTAFGILIPLIMPFKVIIGPASFTLASHVPLFLAIFVSPLVGIYVSLGVTLGFFLAGFPIVIVLRALSQIVFTIIAAWYWKYHQAKLKQKPLALFLFAFAINVIHGLGELLAVLLFSLTGQINLPYLGSLVVLVGLGTLIHGLCDFYLAYYLMKMIKLR